MEQAINLQQELVTFFKVLADPKRLVMLGLLAEQPRTGEQLAALLNLNPSTISHHLAKLSQAGLVSAAAEGYYSVYRLDRQALEERAQLLLADQTLPELAASVDADAYDRKVVRDFSLPDGRLKIIPAQRKKLEAILRHLAQVFEPGRRYTEKEVNATLAAYHEDTATLRRELVGARLLAREAGQYWRL